MADVASLTVGLQLNAANFKSQLMSAYSSADNQSRRFNQNAQTDAKKTEGANRGISTAVTGLAGKLAGLANVDLSIGTIINTTRQYSQALSDLSVITGATGTQLKLFDEAAQQMGRTTGYSASQAAEALKLMASVRPELLNTAYGLTEATESALTLAQAAGSTLPDAAKTLALSLNQFGAGAEQADRYINVLAAGAKFGSSEINDTAAAIKNSGIAAAQTGVGFEQLNAAIQVLAEHEVKGSEAGTALHNVILALENGTDKSLKPSVVGLSQALSNLAGQNLSTTQAVKMFGAENIDSASILVGNRSRMDDLTKSLTGTQTAHEQAAIRVNNLNGDLMGLTSAFEGVIIKIGQSGDGALRSGVQIITDALNVVADNFTTISNIALYTLIPVLSTKLTAGIRESAGAWLVNNAAIKANATAQADIARKTIESAEAALRRNDAEFAHYRQMEKTAKQYGMNVSYQSEFNRLIREETEQTHIATTAKRQLAGANNQMSFSARAARLGSSLLSEALGLVGGPFGVAMIAATGLYALSQNAKEARESALGLKNAVVETIPELIRLSAAKIAVKVDDFSDQVKEIDEQRKRVKSKLERYSDTRINLVKSKKNGVLGFLIESPEDLLKERNSLTSQLEDLNTAAKTATVNLENAKKARDLILNGTAAKANTLADDVSSATNLSGGIKGPTPWNGENSADEYSQLRKSIEDAHASSLGKIYIQERDSQAKILEAAKASGVSEKETQSLLLVNAENYQKQRLELAERYSPARVAISQEQEANRDLKELFSAGLIIEKEYKTSRIQLAQSTAQSVLQAQAESMSVPKLSLGGDVDPLVDLQNQLTKRQDLLKVYYAGDAINKEQYEMLMQKATKDSADSQYQTALELYRSQSDINNLSIGLIETTQERTTNMLFGLLNGTQTFREGMISLFESLTQSIIKNLMDMAVQALLTNTILQSIMGIGGSVFGAVADAGAGGVTPSGAYNSAASNLSFDAFGEVYGSPQMFTLAKSADVFGSAGPEAIMPLTLGTDGSLGARSVGGSGGNPDLQVNINIQSDGSAESTGTGIMQQFGNDVGKFVDQRYRQLVMRDLGQGGAINNAIQGRR